MENTLYGQIAAWTITLGVPLFLAEQSLAQGFTRHEIIDGLARPGGISAAPQTFGKVAVDREQPIAGLSSQTAIAGKSDRDAIARLIAERGLPRIDVEILFRSGSSDIDPAAFADLRELADALRSEELADIRILIAGHTDSLGRADYNADLSLRRAMAVRQHLVDIHGLSSTRMMVTGFGFERLKDSQNPTSAVNRRVELINITELFK